MSKADTLLKKATAFERLALYSDRTAFLQAIAQDADTFSKQEVQQYNNLDEFGRPKQTGIPAPPEDTTLAPAPVMQMPADHITGFAPIPQDQQAALSKIVTIEGLGLPLTPDGKLGPKTKGALRAFKKFINQPNWTDQQALKMAKYMADNLPKYK